MKPLAEKGVFNILLMRSINYFIGLVLILTPFITSAQQGWGVGVRLGDPTAVSAKYYKSNKALEFNLGTSYSFRGYDYTNTFYKKYPTANGYDYVGHKNPSSLDL